MNDLTERPKPTSADAELQEHADEYYSIFELTSNALIIGDLDGTVVQVSPAACRMYGCSPEEFVGLPMIAVLGGEGEILVLRGPGVHQTPVGGRYPVDVTGGPL